MRLADPVDNIKKEGEEDSEDTTEIGSLGSGSISS
jgi:hypothetical protein